MCPGAGAEAGRGLWIDEIRTERNVVHSRTVPPRSHRPTVLVVEDDPELRTFYRTVLTLNGYHIVAVEDGIDALRCIDVDQPPDLVILDLGLARLDGRDVKRELRAGAATRKIPILVITGMDPATLNPEDFQCVVRKPVTAEGLIDAVEQCLRAGG